MLRSAQFTSFTTIPNGTWKFADGLNVIVGENGLGKTHVLKAIYALLKVQSAVSEPSKSALEKTYADKLVTVLRPESLGRLVKRKQGRDRCEIKLTMMQRAKSSAIGFATNAKSHVDVLRAPTAPLESPPVYLPTRELVTLCPWFVSLYDNYHLEFEETWRDTVSLLGAPSVKGPREGSVARLLEPLEEAMGGKVVVDGKSGRFYLQISGEGKMEMPLVAEGVRKIAMIARLISTGVLLEQGYLFWDEPETNLNPRLIKTVAESIMHLARAGIQVFIATHSLFLLREIEMLTEKSTYRDVPCRYFALARTESDVIVEQGDAFDDLRTLVLLDEELAQSDRFLEGEGT
ncbi:AAA family ATPase [Trinickia caryophylli]|uniref:AAA domain-containing protein, putative AbiEii toxin, Type IV TA system n=1 Tax=Trinickia caryophylli TaxID=28094 RepID=A0A1X7H1K1_TRICW|nr:ATP-binding protein [Trinickia caryophylli]PMS09982.1 ATP-binding protein [Trinickia caryophylli]TRX18336.1 AAA family ATPase [Trinickia caryophylli]WQE10880.1 AAA family ATPase [Trinickia caryophylli]SMF77984.1 AAA domain-containing protein, putative AbiEii toxin, Type IV TA system [Trinickia caryophylli]GLU35525.1 ATP-binding protein [Trinickia caryophylli]